MTGRTASARSSCVIGGLERRWAAGLEPWHDLVDEQFEAFPAEFGWHAAHEWFEVDQHVVSFGPSDEFDAFVGCHDDVDALGADGVVVGSLVVVGVHAAVPRRGLRPRSIGRRFVRGVWGDYRPGA